MISLNFAYLIFIIGSFVSLVDSIPTSVPKYTAGHLHVPIKKVASPFKRRLSRRGRTEIELKHDSGTFYSATLEIGTPRQEVAILFDTGSSDMWVASSANPYCLNNQSYSNETYNGQEIVPSIDCEALGSFDFSASSSFKDLDIGRFYISYSDESFADGFWANEKLQINGIDVSSLQFGVADYATVPVGGVLGLGFPRRESVRGYENATNTFYPNFPQVLKNDGVISVASYSLFLNEVDSDLGSILFGAVDPTRYTGSFCTFPMVNEYPDVVDKPATLAITLQALGAKSDNSCKYQTVTTVKQPVLLDSGTTLMTAPPEIADELASFVGATYNETEGIYFFDCPADDDDTEFIFDFGDLNITLPLKSLVIPSVENGSCGFGLTPASYSMTLGAVFLSSAYVAYDLDNYQISIAQANLDGNPSQKGRFQIPEDGNIPGATRATAVPWTTDEPVRVDYDMFENHPSCSTSQTQTTSSSSGLVDTNTSSVTSQVTSVPSSLNLIISSYSTSDQITNSIEDEAIPTSLTQTSFTLTSDATPTTDSSECEAVTITVTAATTVVLGSECQCNA